MNIEKISSKTYSVIATYRIYILVFLTCFFISLTLTHPTILLNDEFITTNQLHQLYAGHQIAGNEGKYGLQQNGSMSAYFAARANILGYSLFQPLISVPAYGIIDLTGDHCVYLILCLWMAILLSILILLHHFYPDLTRIGSHNWISGAYILAFALFFINLIFYASFPVNSFDTFTEIIAIVFTNIILLSIASVLIFDIIQAIFEDSPFAFFGTLVCLFSSSYFVWATHCKDHILILPIFAGIFLCSIRFFKSDEYWYLPLAFLLSGLLAWARPELALWIFIYLIILSMYICIQYSKQRRSAVILLSVILAPLFTFIGAVPFFLNNYLMTKNILLPVQSLYLIEGTPGALFSNNSEPWVRETGVRSFESVVMMFLPKITENFPFDFLSDSAGIFFYPKTGSISLFAVVPLFLAMVVIGWYLFSMKKMQFTSQERTNMSLCIFLSVTIFFGYISQIHSLNADMGIVPDVRYLSPVYIPLMVSGLIILKKADILPKNPVDSIKRLFLIGGIETAILLVSLYGIYTLKLGLPLGKFYSVYALAVVFIFLLGYFFTQCLNLGRILSQNLIIFICFIPFLWQITTLIVVRAVSGYAGYTFWIPVTRVIWEIIVNVRVL